ncbi:MAG: hypothetical protein IK048_05405 [Clostridia bacterium]|nr:hypothetical protein [Clostridia bacterium]
MAGNEAEEKQVIASYRDKVEKEPRKNHPKDDFFKRKGQVWLEYDHAARFYPILATKKAQSNFAVGATLDGPVNPELLERAVNDCAKRFPAFKVKQKRGYAWHYLLENDAPIKVFPLEKAVPCPINSKETNGYLFKLTYGENRIEMIIFHGLCDGNGAIEFLKTILLAYKRLSGVKIENTEGILDHESDFHPHELEDSFVSHYVPIKLGEIDFKKLLGGKPYRIKGQLVRGFETDRLVMDGAEIAKRAKQAGVTFTSYVTGAIAYALDKYDENEHKHNYVIMVPVNLRNLFESTSLRNFVTFVRVIVKPHSFDTVEEYAVEAQKQIAEEASKDKMARFISTSVRAQRGFLMKITPLFLKQFFLKLGRLFTSSRQTIIFSNLGRVAVPKELGVEYFYVNLNASATNTQNLSSVTTDGKAVFTLTRAVKEKDFSDALFALIEKGEI